MRSRAGFSAMRQPCRSSCRATACASSRVRASCGPSGALPRRAASSAARFSASSPSARVVAADAAHPGEWWDGRPFDRILLDVPCSATGVIRRHPDIKVLRRREDIAVFARRQSELLATLWPLLVPGGRLVYASCSILRAENSAVVSGFLAQHPDATMPRPDPAPPGLGRSLAGEPGLYLIVGEAGTDGFYYACLEKTTAAAGTAQQ